MKKAIWKFPLFLQDEQRVEMPFGAEILCAQEQHDGICLWACVNPDNTKHQRTIRIHGTGHEFEEYPRRHIGTVQTMRGSLVWHVFEALS